MSKSRPLRVPNDFASEINRMAREAGVSQAEAMRILGRKFKAKNMKIGRQEDLYW